FCLPFFFQAEDGIRDCHVTGLQTCALPICLRCGRDGQWRCAPAAPRQRSPDPRSLLSLSGDHVGLVESPPREDRSLEHLEVRREIGRASCRARRKSTLSTRTLARTV